MDLSSPLRSIAPSLDSAVLEVLAGTESGLSLAQIARLTGRGSRQGLALVVDRLTEHGLVLADPANRGYLYRLNREHVLADAVLSATRVRLTILDRLARAVTALDPRPRHASVFGSFARREAGPDSDIDMLLVLPDDAVLDDRWQTQVRQLGDAVRAWTGNRLECLVLTEDEVRRAVAEDEPIVASWRTDSVTVHGPPMEDVIRWGASGPGGAAA